MACPRHFAISCWIEAGLAPKTVQTFAGQASLQITMDRCGHLFPHDDHRKAMDQIAKGCVEPLANKHRHFMCHSGWTRRYEMKQHHDSWVR